MSTQTARGGVCLIPNPGPDQKSLQLPEQPQRPDQIPAKDSRIAGLDGLRGLAALYVVIFHVWILSFPHFPRDTGPSWLVWAMYGRLAVVFFLVLSGFSLAVGAQARGWRIGGVIEFARRRAWRILPAYWLALAISLVVARWIVPASHFGPPGKRTAVVHALLLQDVFSVRTPNGALWSIAVEVELYALFPLLVLLRRRLGALALLSLVTLPVVTYGLLAAGHSPVEHLTRLAPNLAPVFVLGMATAGIVKASSRIRSLPWAWFATLAFAPVVAVIALQGPRWTVRHAFWIDLAAAPAMALLVAAVASQRPGGLLRWLRTGTLQRLGASSYSLYLIHLPILMVISRKLAVPVYGRSLAAFALTFALGVPLSLLAARWFAAVAEFPFQRRSGHQAGLRRSRSGENARSHITARCDATAQGI